MIGRNRRLAAGVVYDTQHGTRTQKKGACKRGKLCFPECVHDLWVSRREVMRCMSGNPLRELKRDEAIIVGGPFVRYRTGLKAAWDRNEMGVGRLPGSMRGKA